MKRTITAVTVTVAALVLGGCSSSDNEASDSTPTANLGTTQTVQGDGWAADVTVSDLTVRDMDYYGDIKPERQYQATVSVKSTEGETSFNTLAFNALTDDGTTMTQSVGGESDEIDSSGAVPEGKERTGKVTWTGKPDITIKSITFQSSGTPSLLTWTIPGPPASAPPSRMPNHDEIVARGVATPATSSSAAATTTTAPKTGTLTGRALYEETCTGTKEFFEGLQQLSEMAGEPWDSKKAADDFMDMIQHPEKYPELQPSETATEEEWDDLSKSDQAQVREAVYAAADGKC